jgi:hypothetical protein
VKIFCFEPKVGFGSWKALFSGFCLANQALGRTVNVCSLVKMAMEFPKLLIEQPAAFVGKIFRMEIVDEKRKLCSSLEGTFDFAFGSIKCLSIWQFRGIWIF